MKKAVLLLLVFFSLQTLYADEIHLNSGKIIKGRIIRVTENSVEYDPEGEIPFNILKRKSVSKLKYDSGLEVVISGDGKSADPEKLTESRQTERKFDEIYLLDGRVFRGAVVRMTSEYIEYVPEGKQLKDLLPRGQVSKIAYKNGKVIFVTTSGSGGSKRKKLNKGSQAAKGAHEHDGFLFRLIWGYGGGEVTVDDYIGSDLHLKGINGMIRTQFGYSFGNSINLFLDYAGITVTESEVTWGDIKMENANTEYFSSQLGLGISYYLMPSNFYIALSVCAVVSEFKGDLIDTQDVSGIGYFVSIGKEWWVSNNWGLGISLYYYQEKLDIDDPVMSEKYKVESRSWGIAFTATFN